MNKNKSNSKEEKKLNNLIMDLNEYKKNKSFNPTINLSFIDMVFDKNKRNSVYKEYDEKYESTVEEDEIFKRMTKRRKGGK